AFVASDVKTGQIVSLVGGADFNDVNSGGQLNFGSNQKVSPGSSVKPYDYAALINYNNNVGAGSVLYDTQGAIPGYPCTNKNSPKTDDKANCLWNYDFRYPGPVTLRYALGGSRNVPAVKAMLTVGVDKTINMMEDLMGTKDGYACYRPGTDVSNATKADESQCYGSSAIGDGAYVRLDDHANGIASLARNGSVLPKTYLLKITDGSGKPIMEWTQPKAKQVIKPDAAYIVNMMASDPNASYLPGSYKYHKQKNGWNFAIKTGTTNDNYDGLMASWSPQYATISWIGHHTRQKEIRGTSMEVLTSPISRGWMEAAHANLKAENWSAPAGVKTLPAFVVRNKVSTLGEVVPSQNTDLFPSWYQPKAAGSGTQVTDKVSNKTATSCTPALAKQTLGNSNANLWNVDQWAGGGSNTATTSTGSDDVHKCGDAPPSITLTAPQACRSGDDCPITATVTQGTHPLTDPARAQFPGTVNFSVNGQVIKSMNVSESPSTVTFNFKPTESGQTTITARVIDSVLYDATDSASIATTVAESSNKKLTFNSAKDGKYRWSGGTGPYQVYLNAARSNPICTGQRTDTECDGNKYPGGISVVVIDSTGEEAVTTTR
ncbi:MAG TPA: penicillin-binding transpeptidase domain-containing protein, partial [Candidatus Limnocylindrales bacterium]|nr:penicillin-binding transpeptidase domain-containing protein [Candidatus Limnocylindrales bacterium]